MKTCGDMVNELIKAGRYGTGAVIDAVAGREVPPDFKPSLTNSLANTLAAACEMLTRERARVAELEAALQSAIAEIETQFRRRFVAPEAAELMDRCKALTLARKALETK